jgi:hypothetical protein
MLLPYAVLVAVATVAPSPAPGVGVVPVLTSTPFGAGPGQPVSHTITLSGRVAGSVALRVTFRTTIGLDGLAATTTQGRCQVTDPRTVACDLRLPAADMPATKIVVSGTVAPDTPAGALVQNWVSSHLTEGGSGAADGVASNAYLIPTGAPPRSATTATRPVARHTGTGTAPIAVVAAVLIGLTVALTSLILVRRSRRRGP